jgi:hypothetical protein
MSAFTNRARFEAVNPPRGGPCRVLAGKRFSMPSLRVFACHAD